MQLITRPALFAALALGASTASLFAQGPAEPPRPPLPPPPGHHHGPPPSPLFDALDANHDGVISPDEIANASTALKPLTDASGQITHQALGPVRREKVEEDDDRRPDRDFRPRVHGWDRERRTERRPGPAMDRGDDADGHDRAPRRSDDDQRPHHTPPAARPQPPIDNDDDAAPRPPRPAADRGPQRHHQGPPPDADRDAEHAPAAAPFRGESAVLPPAAPPAKDDAPPADTDDAAKREHHGPPPMPLFDALDANHDGVISTEEMDNAAAALKKFDTKGTGQISRDDVRPPRPARGPGN